MYVVYVFKMNAYADFAAKYVVVEPGAQTLFLCQYSTMIKALFQNLSMPA